MKYRNLIVTVVVALLTPVSVMAEQCYSIIDVNSNKTIFTSQTTPVSMSKWRSLLGDRFHLVISNVQECNETDLSLVDDSLLSGFNRSTVDDIKQSKIDAKERQEQLDNLYGSPSNETGYYRRGRGRITIIGEQEPRTIFPSSRGSGVSSSSGGSVFVRGYYRKNGTYVKSHWRSRRK